MSRASRHKCKRNVRTKVIYRVWYIYTLYIVYLFPNYKSLIKYIILIIKASSVDSSILINIEYINIKTHLKL